MKIEEKLSKADLIHLFPMSKPTFIEAIQNKMSVENLTDYEILDLISNGNGTESYNMLSDHRIQSREYLSSFKYFLNNKTFDLSRPEGFALHVFRNKNQRGKAPKDLKTMMEFVKAGYFKYEGFTPCHNIKVTENTSEKRRATLQEMVYLIKSNLLKTQNKFSPMGNISFRGTPGSNFESCQFVYNYDSGLLVADNVNRGTWDFGKYATPAHYFMDILPWVDVGNGDNMETEDSFYMSPSETKMYLSDSYLYIDVDTNSAIKDDKNNCNVITSYNTFLKNFLEVKKRVKTTKDVETLQEVSAEDYDADVESNKSDKLNLVLKNYIRQNSKRVNSNFQFDWGNYISLCTLLDDGALISDMSKNIDSIETTPSFLKYNINEGKKAEYINWLLKSSIVSTKPEERIVNSIVTNTHKITLKVNLSKSLISYIQMKFGNEGADSAIKAYRKIRDEEIFPVLQERLKKISFDLWYIDDITDIYNITSFTCEISQKRILSLYEMEFIRAIEVELK